MSLETVTQENLMEIYRAVRLMAHMWGSPILLAGLGLYLMVWSYQNYYVPNRISK